jgi:hypothetical protein
MKPRKLTEAIVSGLTPRDKPYLVRDTAVTGLLLAVNKTCKTYKVQRDLWTGKRGQRRLVKTVRHTLGTTDEMNLDCPSSDDLRHLSVFGSEALAHLV